MQPPGTKADQAGTKTLAISKPGEPGHKTLRQMAKDWPNDSCPTRARFEARDLDYKLAVSLVRGAWVVHTRWSSVGGAFGEYVFSR